MEIQNQIAILWYYFNANVPRLTIRKPAPGILSVLTSESKPNPFGKIINKNVQYWGIKHINGLRCNVSVCYQTYSFKCQKQNRTSFLR